MKYGNRSNDEYEDIPENNLLASFPEGKSLTISSVERIKGRYQARYRIYFDEYSLEIHEDVMIKYRMMKGSTFTRQDLESIVQADERQQAYSAALNALSHKPRTRFELKSRLLTKGWGETVIGEVLDGLEREGWINDNDYAQRWAEQRIRSRGKGKLLVRQELSQKGIAKPVIEAALGEVGEEEELHSALLLAEKRWSRTTGESVDKKRKIAAFLMRRGFSGTIASKAVRKITERNGQLNEEEWLDE